MKAKVDNIQCLTVISLMQNINKLQSYYGKAIRANIGVSLMQSINKLQSYYGKAICANIGNVESMETSLLGGVLPLLLPWQKSTTWLLR